MTQPQETFAPCHYPDCGVAVTNPPGRLVLCIDHAAILAQAANEGNTEARARFREHLGLGNVDNS